MMPGITRGTAKSRGHAESWPILKQVHDDLPC